MDDNLYKQVAEQLEMRIKESQEKEKRAAIYRLI